MNSFARILIIFIVSLFCVLISWLFLSQILTKSQPPPVLQDGWWGDGYPSVDDPAITPFNISVPQQDLDDLKQRLEQTRKSAAPLEGIGFEYGFNGDFLEEVRQYWLEKYDWRAEERRLNRWPQFHTQIEGLQVHFLHVKPAEGRRAIPLLLLHGWPGSIVEFQKLIPLLTTPRQGQNFVFEVICPSLPGHAFSEAARKSGLGIIEIAQIMKKLMNRLGYYEYYIQGGNWGAAISSAMARMYPQEVVGLHLNMIFENTPARNFKYLLGALWPRLVLDAKDDWKVYPVSEKFAVIIQEYGYALIHATKPDTLGIPLNDSPIGLAAYIMDKFSILTSRDNLERRDGGLLRSFTLDDLLTNVMVYWVTGSITTSLRLFSEYFSARQQAHKIHEVTVLVPTGLAAFPKEVVLDPEPFIRDTFPHLISYTDMPRGGHFAALQEPHLLADDIWKVVGAVEGGRKEIPLLSSGT